MTVWLRSGGGLVAVWWRFGSKACASGCVSALGLGRKHGPRLELAAGHMLGGLRRGGLVPGWTGHTAACCYRRNSVAVGLQERGVRAARSKETATFKPLVCVGAAVKPGPAE